MAYILVIDDDPDVCSSLTKILAHSGHDVKVAYDGEEGIELFEEHGSFSMVITDIRMPHKDGNWVARHIRSSGGSKDTPVVAMTAYLDDVDRDLFSVVLEKPFKMIDVMNIINFFH